MKRFLFILLSFVLGASVASAQENVSIEDMPFDVTTSDPDGSVIAFIGKKIFVRRDETFPPEPGKKGDDIIIYMDGRYEARYQIEKLVAGSHEGDTIDFHAYDHYGMPRFSNVEEALIFVYNNPEGRVHSKYNYYEVHPTSDGDWAACGDAYVQYDPEEEEKEPLELIPFLDPVEVDVTALTLTVEDQLDPGETISDAERLEWQAELDEENTETEGLYQPPIWSRNGSKATCQMGTRVSELYKFQNENRFLVERREDICRDRHANALDAFGNDYKAKRALMKDCTDLLKIQNLP